MIVDSDLRIYVTYCSTKKDDSLRGTQRRVTPDRLYKSLRIQRFMKTCGEKKVNWAIFSDLYGIWFPDVRHEWYEKNPSRVTEGEFRKLAHDFDEELEKYDEIWFYYSPNRFHSLYRRLIDESKLADRVTRFTHVSEITVLSDTIE
jgi:hypothetical protein